ncbi:sel1 repeat family protein [Marinobacter hydrocarbonoclasticus]|uniref:tetratricopeptide repeat protein n=1 Tax=Marinobacter nauticus TaxID=2743 RepID=UPI001A8C3658|nr:SEL1-like repeat protein [Marinobacter nauticus]MBN8240674.1 sel1 repeat family protein [Marinobacter nauticus]
MSRKAAVISALLIGLAGCSGVPDIDRAERQAEAGNVEAARAQLEELARFGIVDAQVELGDLYAEMESPQNRQKALHWYSKASEQGSDRAWVRLGKLLTREGETAVQRAEGERYLKKAFAEGDDSALMPLVALYLDYPGEFPNAQPRKWIERARKAGDPAGDLALARYYLMTGQAPGRGGEIVSLCDPLVETHPDCLMILGQVYLGQERSEEFEALVDRARAAWKAGRISDRDLYLFARWMSDDDSPAKQVATSNELYQLLTPGYVPAMTGRARLIMDNTYLADSEEVVKLLEASRAAGDLKASLVLARVYERGRIVPMDPEKAVRYAEEARERYVSADYLLGRIYKRGYLGEADPHKARDHLLRAARRGYPKADYLLAEMFWEGKGIEVNKSYAWAFALLALEGGVERGKDLLLEMVPAMPRVLEHEAEAIAEREAAARQRWKRQETANARTNTTQGG